MRTCNAERGRPRGATKLPKDLARIAVATEIAARELARAMGDVARQVEELEREGAASLQALAPYLPDGERVFLLVDSFWDSEGTPSARWARRALEVTRRGDRVYGEVHDLVLPDRLTRVDAGADAAAEAPPRRDEPADLRLVDPRSA